MRIYGKTSGMGRQPLLVGASLMLASSLGLAGCNKSKFVSQTGKQLANPSGGGTPAPAPTPKFDGGFGSPPSFSISEALSTSQSENAAWIVNSDGNGFKISLDAQADYPMTSFKGLGGGGHRTFATRYGLFVGTTAVSGDATSGKIYYVPRNVVEGASAVVAVDLNTLGGGNAIINAGAYASRICVIMYSVNGIDYIGAAYTTAGGGSTLRKFYRAPVDIGKPGLVDTSKQQILDAGEGNWGYSCAYDPKRNYFYGKQHATGGIVTGVDLASPGPTNMKIVNAPNFNHNMTGLNSEFAFDLDGATAGSYALAITANGEVLSDSLGKTYTMAHDPLTANVFISNQGEGKVHVISDKCFKDLASCSGSSTGYDVYDGTCGGDWTAKLT